MPIAVTCARCGKRVSVRDELVGRAVQCPQCKSPLPTGSTRPVSTLPRGSAAKASGSSSSLWRSTGVTAMILGAIGAVGPAFGLSLRKFRDQAVGVQVGLGIALLVCGAILFGISHLSARLRRTIGLGVAGLFACFVLLAIAAVVFGPGAIARKKAELAEAKAAAIEPAEPASPPADARPAAPRPKPPAAVAAASADPALAPDGLPDLPPANQTRVAIITKPFELPANMSEFEKSFNETVAIELRNTKPGDWDSILRALRNSFFMEAKIMRPDANGVTRIWAWSDMAWVKKAQRMGRIVDEGKDSVVIQWGEFAKPEPVAAKPIPKPAVAPPPAPAAWQAAVPDAIKAKRVSAPPAWRNDAHASRVVIRNATAADADKIDAAIDRADWPPDVEMIVPAAGGSIEVYVHLDPASAVETQELGRVERVDGKTVHIAWNEPTGRPGRPGEPVWADEPNVTKFLIRGVPRAERPAVMKAAMRSTLPGMHLRYSVDDRCFVVWSRVPPEQAIGRQQLGTVTRRDGKVVELLWRK